MTVYPQLTSTLRKIFTFHIWKRAGNLERIKFRNEANFDDFLKIESYLKKAVLLK